MPCDVRHTPEGGVVICCRRSHRQYCAECRAEGITRESTKLCDGPALEGSGRKTCDKPLCNLHAWRVGFDRDLCTECRAKAASR